MKFNEGLREIRRQSGMTQKDVYTLLQVSPNCYASWEQGRTQPDIESIKKLCIIFDVSADYLLGLKPELAEGYDLNATFIQGVKIKDVLISLRKLSPNNKKEALKFLSYLNSTQ